MKKLINLTLLIFIFCEPGFSQQKTDSFSISSLKFLGEYFVPHKQAFKGTTIGGLSGIDFDSIRNQYYLVSDDRSAINPARFYTAKIFFTPDGIDSVVFTDVTSFLQSNGKVYPNSKQDAFHTPDPEALRYNPVNDEMVWSSEGERIVKAGDTVLEDPSVIAIERNGSYKDSFALPANMHMHATENGPRQNSVFEGVTFSGDHKNLFVSVEEPIYEDGPRAGLRDSAAWTRIIKFDMEKKIPLAEYAYKLEAVAHAPVLPNGYKINGISDILWTEGNKLIVVERSYSTGRLRCTIRVFWAKVDGASDVSDTTSLPAGQDVKPLSKKLLLNMDKLGRYIDNIEGVTFGPDLPDGHHSLIFVADDNFSIFQKNQFLLFEVIP